MVEATFWFSSPFREWICQRTVAVRWEGCITLREVFERLAADNSGFRTNVTGGGLRQETFDNLAAVILEGDFLALASTIPDGAKVDVLTPLAGGRSHAPTDTPLRALPSPLLPPAQFWRQPRIRRARASA